MFDRNVRMPDGSVADRHEVVTVEHHLEADTVVSVLSTRTADGTEMTTSLSHGLDDTLTIAAAETWVMGLPEFAEYVDPAQEALDTLLPSLDDEQAELVPSAWPVWSGDGVSYSVGDRVRHEDALWRCLQAHVSQSDWAPSAAHSLWVRTSPEAIPDWVQPTGSTDAYNTGDKVRYEGRVYESTIDGNVWSPTDYPQGWRLVE